MKKILIAYASYGKGHETSALSLYNYYKDKEYDVRLIDINTYSSILGKIVIFLYYRVIKYNRLYNFMYNITDNDKYNKIYKYIIRLLYKDSLKSYIIGYSPNIVISTHYFPNILISMYKINTKKISIVTDYAIHYTHYYNIDNEDALVVPTNDIKEYLKNKYIDISRVYVCGIPSNKSNIINIYKLDKSNNTILYIVNKYKYIYYLLKERININLILVCGNNERLRLKIEKLIKKYNYKNILVLGYSKDITNLIRLSKIIITKPGGLSITECLKERKPLILVKGIGGQERLNTKYIINNNYGYSANNYKELIYNIYKLLDINIYNSIIDNINKYNVHNTIKEIDNIVNKII